MENKKNIPKCIGIIMDGNRRWAKEQGLTSLEGHQRGYEKLKEVLGWAKDVGIENMITYAFSTENWNRSEEEVSYLLDLFRKMLTEELEELMKEDARIIFAGDISRFPEDIQTSIAEVHKKTKDKTPFTLVVALSYGGRAEILRAVNEIVMNADSGDKHVVTEEEFARHLWTKDVPDPDMIIRTGGEWRLSGFLPWQSVYSELFFPETYWPAFTKEEFDGLIAEFAQRERRRGK
ncbi:MAG: polyprenyl diphosphate synthase [Candidatus Pacebacteria bacterium]|nr:polyprenyl diphosphate synthase [Candidatus Paceibacterota bacterium]